MMTDHENKRYADAQVKGIWLALVQIVSDIFSPLLVPTYCVALCLWVTPMRMFPSRPRLLATIVVFLLTAALPFLLRVLLARSRKNIHMEYGREAKRVWYLIFNAVCCVCAAIYLNLILAPWWLVSLFYGLGASVAIASLVDLRWCISVHSLGMGCFCALSFWLGYHRLLMFNTIFFMSMAMSLAGLVGTSRVALGRVGPCRVAAGFVLGAACMYMALSI